MESKTITIFRIHTIAGTCQSHKMTVVALHQCNLVQRHDGEHCCKCGYKWNGESE